MSTQTEGRHVGEFLLSEGNGSISRDQVTVTLSGAALASGTVMSRLTASGKWVPYDDVGTDGSEVASGILYTELAAGTGDVTAVMIVRHAEVQQSELTGFNANARADLAAVGIIVR